MDSKKIFEKYPIVELILGVLVLILFLANLGNIYLWQDEAQRANIAKTILHGGLPRGYDGVNYFSQEMGREYGTGYLWKWNPWLPFYVLVLFFSVHISTFTARLPFVLFGMATVALAYLFVRSIHHERRPALLTAGILATSVPFLLLSRQCNYYSMTAFFSLLSLYGYSRITAGRKHAYILTIIALTLLFHSHYIYCVPCGAAMLGHTLIYRRDLVKRLFLLYAAVVVINIPGILWYGGTSYSGNYELMHSGISFIRFNISYFEQIASYIFPAAFFLLLVILWCVAGVRTQRLIPLDQATTEFVLLLLIFACTCVLMLSVVSPAPFFRYLSPLVPLGAILVAMIAEAAFRRHVVLGLMVVMLWVFSHPMKEYLYELTHDYHGPIGGIVAFFKTNAQPGDVVAITYGDQSVKFYTGLRVVGGLTGEDLEPARNADWVIIRKHVICDKDLKVREYLVKNLNAADYQQIRLNAPDVSFENRESPQQHLFRTPQGEDSVIIYKKIVY